MSIAQDITLWAARKAFKGKNTLDLAPLQQNEAGALKVALVQANESFPTVTLGSVTVGTLPALTANPTRPTLLAQVLLSASDATLYTAAANWRDVVIYVKNVDTVARTANLALNSTYTDTTAIVKNMPLEVGCRVAVCLPALASGQLIRGLCSSASAASVEIWGTAA
jgi:hypothetical protein